MGENNVFNVEARRLTICGLLLGIRLRLFGCGKTSNHKTTYAYINRFSRVNQPADQRSTIDRKTGVIPFDDNLFLHRDRVRNIWGIVIGKTTTRVNWAPAQANGTHINAYISKYILLSMQLRKKFRYKRKKNVWN